MPFPAKTNPESILNAALEMLERDGPEALSMRNLATVLEMKAPSLYRHYPDKAALETALKMRGAELLQAALEKASVDQEPTQAMHKAANACDDEDTNDPFDCFFHALGSLYSGSIRNCEGDFLAARAR